MQRGCIYLLREREFVNTDTPIYKIGMTRHSNCERLCKYPKGSQLELCKSCDDCVAQEQQLLSVFRDKFVPRRDIGSEYFEGNVELMADLIYQCIKQESPSNIQTLTDPDKNILDFTDSDYSMVDKDMIHTLIKNGRQSFGWFVSQIHFNLSYPANHNIYINDVNSTKAAVIKDGKWCQCDWNDIADQLIEHIYDRLHGWYDRYSATYSDYIYNYNLLLTHRDNARIINRIRFNIKNTAYQNKYIVDISDSIVDTLSKNVVSNSAPVLASRNNYDETDYNIITKDIIDHAITLGEDCIEYLIRYTHFNPDFPNNHNIYLPDRKHEFVRVFRENEWTNCARKTTVYQLIDDTFATLEYWVDNHPAYRFKVSEYLKKRLNTTCMSNLYFQILKLIHRSKDVIDIQ